MECDNFKMNAASELWAELFMIRHLQPDLPEAQLIDDTMKSVGRNPDCRAIAGLANKVRLALR